MKKMCSISFSNSRTRSPGKSHSFSCEASQKEAPDACEEVHGRLVCSTDSVRRPSWNRNWAFAFQNGNPRKVQRGGKVQGRGKVRSGGQESRQGRGQSSSQGQGSMPGIIFWESQKHLLNSHIQFQVVPGASETKDKENVPEPKVDERIQGHEKNAPTSANEV